MGLKPEAGRAERGRGADSESESESEAHEGGPREPARELQSKFREAPSGWLCRNDPGSDWALDLRATGRALALASHPSLLAGPSLADRAAAAAAARARAIAAFQVCHGLAPGPGLARVTQSPAGSRTQTRNLNLKP